MKKFYALLLLAIMLPLQACAQEQWREGEHFVVLNDSKVETKEVVEFFSFWCPHCYNFEPLVQQIKGKLADDVVFTKVHVNFMGFAGPDTQDAATRAMLVGRAMKQEDKFNAAIFQHLHVQRGSIFNLDDLKQIFNANGVAPEDFAKRAASFGVESQLKKNNNAISEYRRYLKGVPNFIVNGKYQATFVRGMTADDMVDLVVWLSQQP